MHPICFRLGSLTIHWYGVFMALAFLTGFLHWVTLGRRDNRSAQFCSDLLFWVMIAGILGGRVAYVISDWPYYAADPKRILFVWEGGLIYYGGFVGGVFAIYLFARNRGQRFLSVLDLAIVPLPLSHALGRIGCFMNGCCFGDVCAAGPAVRFPAESMPWVRQVQLGFVSESAPHSLPVYPVQLYEAGANVLVYLLLLGLYRRRAPDGAVTGAYLAAYPVGRFLLEFLRGTERVKWGGVPVAQVLSLALFALGVLVLLGVYRRSRTARGST